MKKGKSRLFAAVPLAIAILIAGCAGDRSAGSRPTVAAATQAQVIPFDEASATFDAAHNLYRIDWRAPGVGRVQVFAGKSPGGIDRNRPVATGLAGTPILIDGLAADSRWYFSLVPDHGGELIIADRSLHLANAPNLRDAGGYRTTDGRWVKMGILYRSDQLDRLDESDLDRIAALGLGTIADLRTATEREREPDRLPAGVAHVVLDVAADAAGSLGGDMRQAMGMIAAGRGAELLTEANRDFVAQPGARAAYAKLITRAATGEGGLLYHCTSGKDRTGWASAVLLSLLGVPRETIMQDYLASNGYLAEKNRASIAMLSRSGAPIKAADLEPVLIVRRDYIAAAFAEVDRRYGTMEAYARDGLGIDAAMLARLRSHMLAGAPQPEGVRK